MGEANTSWNDARYACRHHRRTVLMNAAQRQLIPPSASILPNISQMFDVAKQYTVGQSAG